MADECLAWRLTLIGPASLRRSVCAPGDDRSILSQTACEKECHYVEILPTCGEPREGAANVPSQGAVPRSPRPPASGAPRGPILSRRPLRLAPRPLPGGGRPVLAGPRGADGEPGTAALGLGRLDRRWGFD